MFVGLRVDPVEPTCVEQIVEWCCVLKPTETRPSQLASKTFDLPFLRSVDFTFLLRSDDFKFLLEQRWKEPFQWLINTNSDGNLDWLLQNQRVLLHLIGNKEGEAQYSIIGCCTDLTRHPSCWYIWRSAPSDQTYVKQIVEWCSVLKPTEARPNQLASHVFTRLEIEPYFCYDDFKALLEQTWHETFEWLVTAHVWKNLEWMLRSRHHLLHLKGTKHDAAYVIIGCCTKLPTCCWPSFF